MQITRLTIPAFPALSEDEIASWLRIEADQDADTLTMLVGSATEYVEALTGRRLGLSTFRVELDGIDECYRLPIAPVQSITKVEYRDKGGILHEIDEWALVGGGFLRLTSLSPGFPIVTLEAGYPDNTSVPVSLAHAVAVLVSAGYNGREEISDQTIKTVDRLCQPHKRFSW